MAWAVTGDLAHNGMVESGTHGCSQNKQEGSSQWYLSKKDIEENSPSRRDGIDLKKETYLRKSYCTFMQDLGMRLKVPQVTIATAIIFCHRFFLYQSHAKNDRRTIAAVCMFLAGKVEETPRPLKDVIIVSYEIIHKRDPAAGQRIRQRDVYEQQKGLILTGERVVLTTLGFDLNVLQPYRPLVEAIKKLKVAQNSLAQVAWNFVNDGLRTSLCLQFKAHHIAAGAIFLAAKFLKVKLPSEGEKVWWKEFGVTARQLEEVSNQMLELYEQNRTPTSQGSEAGASPGGWASHQAPVKLVTGEGSVSQKSHSQLERMSTVKPGSVKPGSLNPSIASSGSDQRHANYKEGDLHENSQSRSNDHGSTESKSDISEHRLDDEIKESRHPKQHPLPHITDKMSEASDRSRFGSKPKIEVGMEDVKPTNTELEEQKSEITTGKIDCKNLENKDYLGLQREDGIKKIDKEKVKAALEKRKKSRGDVARKELMDDDDLIERELEDGIELAIEDEKVKRRGNQDQFNPSNSHYEKDPKKIGNDIQQDTEKQGSRRLHADDVEDGELSMIDDVEVPQSPKSISRKRKAESPGRHLDDISSGDRNWVGQHNYMEKDHKRHAADNRM